MENESWPRRRPDVLAEFLPDGGAVLYDPRTEIVNPLTATAAIIWERCDGAHTTAAMADELAAGFDAPSDVIENDIRALIGKFVEIGMLEQSQGALG